MQSSTFRFYHLKISAKRLPGRQLRLDPLAVVFVGGAGQWNEIGRTEKRLNEWNPSFAKSITLPGDNDNQRRAQVRVDFYNKEMTESRFLGTCEVNFYALIHAKGTSVELELNTPEPVKGSPRVFLTAQEGYNQPGADSSSLVNLSMQLMQTNYYGVSMRIYYEISRAGNGTWVPVHKSENIQIDEQGWGQFPANKISMQDLTMDEESCGLLFNLYRYRRLGSKKLLGCFQTSILELSRKSVGEFVQFTPNHKEGLLAADVQVLHTQKTGSTYDVSLKLVNVQWNATLLTEATVV
ncbi:unnamed protein product [Chondrus crispus]|uniref:C2 domain-containing protein n=1 Tax=Chondrus crispus TaxID=2769 RepID=R7QJD6_CHOCR|nr:unnamed protein product [Chondrus crispus]CDF37571.1 unnamed protein product [Chondrus crispus]|eukprot:XP_005717442.1 unnamed protein product [Chondrus crispus]